KNGEVIAIVDAVQVGFDVAGERLIVRSLRKCSGVLRIGEQLDVVVGEERRFIGELAVLFILAGELTSRYFTSFHVGLIEGIDANYRAGHSRCDFPAEELLAKVINVFHRDTNYWVAGFLERLNRRVLRRVRRGV